MDCSSINAFIDHIKYVRRYSKHTLIAYKGDLKQFQSFHKANILLASKENIIGWLKSLEKTHNPKSINRKLFVLRSFFRYHYHKGNIKTRPCLGIRRFRTYKFEIKVLEEKLVRQVLDSIIPGQNRKLLRDKLILELLYLTACRVGELIEIRKSTVYLYEFYIKVKGKGNKERLLPLNDNLIELIKQYRKLWKAKNKGFRLLNSNDGRKLNTMFVWRTLRKYFPYERLLIPISPHVIRHTTATHLFERGASINIIKQFLGHYKITTTSLYIHIRPAVLKRIYDRAHPKA